jgi:hypothetical protein
MVDAGGTLAVRLAPGLRAGAHPVMVDAGGTLAVHRKVA